MKKKFIIFTVIFNSIYVTLVVLVVGKHYPETQNNPRFYYLYWVGGEIIIFVGSFLRVFYYMTRYHKLEFELIRTQLFAYFCLQMVTLLATLIKLKFFYYGVNVDTLSHMSKECDKRGKMIKIGYLVDQFNQIILLTAAVAVLYFKKQDDILQGVNKLDYLLHISIF